MITNVHDGLDWKRGLVINNANNDQHWKTRSEDHKEEMKLNDMAICTWTREEDWRR